MLRRTARQHETLRTQAGVQADDYADFSVRERVMTTDGYAGRIEAVYDGPYPGSEEYDVKLDGGMGGGIYSAAQLKKMSDEEYTATKDYPELSEILSERPDPAKQVVLAKKTATTINDVKIDDHGSAPHEVRAKDPNAYDKKSTEGDPDPHQQEPLDKNKAEAERGAEIMKAPGGISFGQLLVAAEWNDPEHGLNHHRPWDNGGHEDHSTGWMDPEHGTSYDQHLVEPESDGGCYIEHDGPCEYKDEPPRKTAMPSKGHPEPEGFSHVVERSSFDDPEEPTHRLIGAVNGQQVGTISFSKSDDGKAVHVHAMHVNPEGRHKGVASAMMDRLYSEHPDAWIDHGIRTGKGLKWWAQYEDPAPERNTQLHQPSEGWGDYFHPRAVSRDMADNYIGDHEHNPLMSMKYEGYEEPEQDDYGASKSMRGPQWSVYRREQALAHLSRKSDELPPLPEGEGDGLDDVLFPGGHAGDRWFERVPTTMNYVPPETGGQSEPDPQRRADTTRWNGEYPEKNHQLFSENSKRLSDPYALVTQAATDPELRWHFTAAWADVRAKAKRIRTEGKVRVTLATDGMIIGEVQGDHHTYESGIQRLPGQRLSVSGWSCGCKWGAYHWGAADDFSRFAGRMCSHALALQFEAQSRGMFGNVVEIDKTKPDWVPPRVVVKYSPDDGKNTMVRSSAKHARLLDTPKQAFCVWALAQGEDEESVALLLRTANMSGQQGLFPEPERQEVKKSEPVWYHGTRHELQPGQHIEPGRKSNQGYGQPNDKVFFSSRPEIAAFFAHAGEGPEDDYDARPRVYRVKTTGPWEPDKDEEWQTGSHQSRHPVQVEAEEPWSPRWTRFISEGAVNSPWGEPSVEAPTKPYGATSPHNPYQSPASAGFLTAPDPDSWSMLDSSGMSVTTTRHEATPDEAEDWDLSPEEREARWPKLFSTLHPEPEAALPSTDGELEEGDLEPENPSIMTMGQAMEVSRQVMLAAEAERTALAEREANQLGGDDEGLDVTAPGNGEDDDLVSQFQNTAAAQALMSGGGGSGGDYSDGDIAKAAKLALKSFTPSEQQALIDEGMGVQASNLDRLDIAGTHYADLNDEEDAAWMI